jgi:hypothetical protein
MDHFKFELIRASESQEITHSRSTKFAAVTVTELVDAFIDFALGCGYYRESLVEAFAEYIDDEPQQYCLEAMDPPETNSQPTSNPSQIRSSLVDQIASALADGLQGPRDEELCETYRTAYYAEPNRQGPHCQAAALRAVLARWGKS